MLISRCVALASCVLLSTGAALAEPAAVDQSTEQAAAAAPAIQAAAVTTAVDGAKAEIAVAATEISATAAEPVAAAEPAKPAVVPDPSPTLTVNIDLAQQQMVVFEDGAAKYSWPISSGTAQFPTPRGTFRPQWSAKMWYSRKYDMAPMPHAVFIHGGVAVHATQHVSRLGSPASHGCIRLAPGNARTFYNLVQRHGYKSTRVAIHGTPKFRAPAIATRKKIKPQQYAVQQDSGWWFSGPTSYQPASAYDPNFAKAKRKAALRYKAAPQKRLYYRTANGQRVVYVPRPPNASSNW